ncbi:4'-phosphopantetheinyl transferase family protein [Streptomyces hyaluromycini]|uniref:4'-phosphopantetheinyl transferase family protein n=1 Tax=Streptomyces hyaluromycini TaxID=1377993 RepID=UPI000B5CF12F|nr:4'-phosphopantetheinyl transferase superfamily protein [Streptomyces hyaluromycini]
MIEEIVPEEVAAVGSRVDAPETALFPEELALIASAVPRRRAEFTTARVCARRALARLGVAAAPILSGAQREPIWPDGVVGSITHCAGYRAAAIGRSTRFTTIGIDVEPNEPLPGGLLEHVSLPQERGRQTRADGTHLDRLLFSAKESAYKAWFPLARRWLGFEQAAITLESDGTFDVELLVAGPVKGFRGRWLARDGLIVTAIATPAQRPRKDQFSHRISSTRQDCPSE